MFSGGDALGSGFAQAERRIADVIARGSDLLSLCGLGLTTLPPSIPSHLRGLDLSGNRLKTLPPNVAGFTNLELLDLGNNRFDVLPPQICELEQLISLDLSENRLVELPMQIGKLGNLTELSIYHNRLARISEALLSLSKLRRLDLSTNKLSALPVFDHRLSQLEVLDVGWNELKSVPDGLDQLLGLRALNLEGNQIVSTDGVWTIVGLEELNLSDNRIAELPATALALKKLRVLEAQGNSFGQLPIALGELAAQSLRTSAATAIEEFISGGVQRHKTYFEPVPFVFGCVLAIGVLPSLMLAIDRLFKRYGDVTTVVLEFPSGSRVTLANLSHRRALEIAREHESELQSAAVRLDLGETQSYQQAERVKAFAVDVLTRVPASSLLSKASGASAQQFIIYNGPTYSPVMTGPLAREETMGDRITISDVQSSIVSVKSKFQQVSQLIGTAPIEGAKKDELKRLVQQLHGSLETVPPEKRQDAEAVAEMLKDTMDKLAQPQPNKKTLEFSLKGMLSAAKDLTEALPIAVKLAAAVAAMFGLVI